MSIFTYKTLLITGWHAMQVPAGAWLNIEVLEHRIIFEDKDGAYKSRFSFINKVNNLPR